MCAGILPPQARARTCTPNSAKARLVHSPVHIPEQERLSRGTGPWSRTLPSPRHGRRGQFVTYPHCEINCGGGDRRMSRRVGARGGRRRASASPACGDPTPGNGPPSAIAAGSTRSRAGDGHGPFTGRPCRSRCCQRRCAAFSSSISSSVARSRTLEKLPLPGRDRLLRRLATPSGLGHRHLPADDCENKPILVFNRENRRTCHGPLPSRGARH